jgi:hypothetical protein
MTTYARLEKPKLKALEDALEDPRWDFRTIEGLASDLALPSEAVAEVLRAFPKIARKSILTDHEGRNLYTASNRPLKLRERFERLRSVL